MLIYNEKICNIWLLEVFLNLKNNKIIAWIIATLKLRLFVNEYNAFGHCFFNIIGCLWRRWYSIPNWWNHWNTFWKLSLCNTSLCSGNLEIPMTYIFNRLVEYVMVILLKLFHIFPLLSLCFASLIACKHANCWCHTYISPDFLILLSF